MSGVTISFLHFVCKKLTHYSSVLITPISFSVTSNINPISSNHHSFKFKTEGTCIQTAWRIVRVHKIYTDAKHVWQATQFKHLTYFALLSWNQPTVITTVVPDVNLSIHCNILHHLTLFPFDFELKYTVDSTFRF
jgi:hypothetical protein